VLDNFEFIREINQMLNGEIEWVVFKAMELGGLWIKIKSINLLEISDRVNWWTVILQVSIGKQWKEFLDYNETIGFIFHVRTLLFVHLCMYIVRYQLLLVVLHGGGYWVYVLNCVFRMMRRKTEMPRIATQYDL
jgi:hypothetical protein